MSMVGERIRQVRESKGLSQAAFAGELNGNFFQTEISAIELGKHDRCSESREGAIIQAVCNRFGVSEQWLRTGKVEDPIESRVIRRPANGEGTKADVVELLEAKKAEIEKDLDEYMREADRKLTALKGAIEVLAA